MMGDPTQTTDEDTLRNEVRKAYAGRAQDQGCCGPTAGTAAHEQAALKMGYSREDVAGVPEGANLGLGCGAPLQLADLQPGEVVLDLGSGAGFDAFLAAREVGPGGRVIGVDMTPEMVARAQENARAGGIENVEFREGFIESLPVADASVDVVISNCVINLSPDKPAVFRDSFRVLKPGGRLVVSDIVLTRELPAAIGSSIAAYVGCLAGASLIGDYLGAVRDAGFQEVEVVESRPAANVLSFDDPLVQAVMEDVGDASSWDLEEVASRVISAKLVARKRQSDITS